MDQHGVPRLGAAIFHSKDNFLFNTGSAKYLLGAVSSGFGQRSKPVKLDKCQIGHRVAPLLEQPRDGRIRQQQS